LLYIYTSMLKKIYKKDGKIIIMNHDLNNDILFYYYLINHINEDKKLDEHKKKFYEMKGFIY